MTAADPKQPVVLWRRNRELVRCLANQESSQRHKLKQSYVLIRKVSPYTDTDLLLGVFATREAAETAANIYREAVIGSDTDPLKDQAYHSVSEEDVVILCNIPIAGEAAIQTENVWVVSSYSEGFGQTLREFVGISLNESDAIELARSIDAKSEGPGFPAYCAVDSIPMGELQYPETGEHDFFAE